MLSSDYLGTLEVVFEVWRLFQLSSCASPKMRCFVLVPFVRARQLCQPCRAKPTPTGDFSLVPQYARCLPDSTHSFILPFTSSTSCSLVFHPRYSRYLPGKDAHRPRHARPTLPLHLRPKDVRSLVVHLPHPPLLTIHPNTLPTDPLCPRLLLQPSNPRPSTHRNLRPPPRCTSTARLRSRLLTKTTPPPLRNAER